MIFYNKDKDGDPIAYIRCDCGTHGIQLQKITFKDEDIKPDIYISLFTDNFYWKQYNWFDRLKAKFVQIFATLLGKGYRCESELVLSTNDLEELIKVLNEFREGNKNEN